MNKKAITLICILTTLAFSQLACNFTDRFTNDGESQDSPQQDASPDQSVDPDEEASPSNQTGDSHYEEDWESCSLSFQGSTNLTEGQAFQAGENIQVVFSLTNDGTCAWDPGASLVMVDGDLIPQNPVLPLSAEIQPGESVQVEGGFTAPSGEGVYMSIWKLQDKDGAVFGQGDPPKVPMRIKIRVVPSGNPQPSPSPTPNSQASEDQLTMLDEQCFDFNTGSVVDCADSSADFWYSYNPVTDGNLYKANDNIFGSHHSGIPDLSTCENDSYVPMPHPVQENQYLCFKIETLASTTYGWIRATHHNEDGLTFDFDLLGSGPPLVTAVPNLSLFVESQGEQITLMEGECFDVWNGEVNGSCSGVFAGFLFEEVTKKNLQVAQISPNEMYFSPAMSSPPTRSDCQNASYSISQIWPIQETSYYCYQFVPGTTAYYGWLRPTSFNLSGITFDYLTWQSTP